MRSSEGGAFLSEAVSAELPIIEQSAIIVRNRFIYLLSLASSASLRTSRKHGIFAPVRPHFDKQRQKHLPLQQSLPARAGHRSQSFSESPPCPDENGLLTVTLDVNRGGNLRNAVAVSLPMSSISMADRVRHFVAGCAENLLAYHLGGDESHRLIGQIVLSGTAAVLRAG